MTSNPSDNNDVRVFTSALNLKVLDDPIPNFDALRKIIPGNQYFRQSKPISNSPKSKSYI